MANIIDLVFVFHGSLFTVNLSVDFNYRKVIANHFAQAPDYLLNR
ncbi:hypothetical protein ACWOB4_09345 [Enterococcus songbeiensis]